MTDYDTDILTWSERQTALLRRVGAGEAVNEVPDLPVAVASSIAAHAESRGVAAVARCPDLAGRRDRLSPAGCGFQCIAATCYDLIAARLPI